VGLDRAAISASRLAELNEDAQVQAVQGPLTAELLESTKVRLIPVSWLTFFGRSLGCILQESGDLA
jgi:hypothetical protein